jgi:two-component system, LytTR family, response regulator
MDKFNVIIIEDESNIREALKEMIINNCPEFNVCGTAGSAEEGRHLLSKYSVDFIFLDISMPNENGFEFLERIPKNKFGIIFTTAFQEYALRALKANAIDYLLKPIGLEELRIAVEKAINYHLLRTNDRELQFIYSESLKNLKSNFLARERPISKITVAEQFGFRIVSVHDLMYLSADSNYTELYLNDGKKIVSTRNLGEFDKILSNPEFFRIHKSVLLNVNYISGFSSYQGNYAELRDGTRLNVSRRKLSEFRSWIKKYAISID